jgi:hypothetical protein
MNIEHFILPILTLIIAVCSIFVAPKNMERHRKIVILFISALVISCGFEIFFSLQRQEAADREIAWNKQHIKDLTYIIKKFKLETDKRFSNLQFQLRSFGWSDKKLSKLSPYQASFEAQKERNILIAATSQLYRKSVTIQYFPKDVDKRIVRKALKELGFRVILGRTVVHDIPTNSIWFGSRVRIEDVKLVAYTLIRAGVEIKAIRLFRRSKKNCEYLVQVGADSALKDKPPLSVAEIREAKEFERDEV